MHTKPLTHQPVAVLDPSNDLGVIRRMLVAAAISPTFCTQFLDDPRLAVQKGFWGEQFYLSGEILDRLASIRAQTLQEFVQLLDENLANRLLTPGYSEVDR